MVIKLGVAGLFMDGEVSRFEWIKETAKLPETIAMDIAPTPSLQCKSAGLDSLAEFSRITGESVTNLVNWHKNRPLRFKLLLAGAVLVKRKKSPINSC